MRLPFLAENTPLGVFRPNRFLDVNVQGSRIAAVEESQNFKSFPEVTPRSPTIRVHCWVVSQNISLLIKYCFLSETSILQSYECSITLFEGRWIPRVLQELEEEGGRLKRT